MLAALPAGDAPSPVSEGTMTPFRADDDGTGRPPSEANADVEPGCDGGVYDWVWPHPHVGTAPSAERTTTPSHLKPESMSP